MPELTLILGGARSGKSTAAEKMAQESGGDGVLYIATAQAWDDEMRVRIHNHRQKRPATWRTIEAPQHVADALQGVTLPPVVLLDCVTLLTSNVLLALPEDATQAQANEAIMAEIDALLAVQRASSSSWILVSNEVGMGIVPAYRLGRLYRDALGMANQHLARAATRVILMVAGLPWELKRL
jgi:adenosylcobinamide kinase/adenosylcobinamide-phosphate guanylyltransferase